MLDIFIFFLFFSFIVASISQDRVIFTILYLFSGAYLLGIFWSKRSIQNLRFERNLESFAFIDDIVRVEIKIQNTGWLPIVWSKIQEALPTELSEKGSIKRVISIGPKESIQFTYELTPKKRGYYRIGPFTLATGDVLGLSNEVRFVSDPDYITVSPRVIPFKFVQLPSSSPIGVIRHIQPVFEDPSKCVGKRNYLPGDSLRRIDWKASAAVGNLQVKLFEPSVDLQVFLFLNLNLQEYATRFKSTFCELAIITAASISRWIIDQRLAIGLFINGTDQANPLRRLDFVQPRKGRVQLIRILGYLARSQPGDLASIREVVVDQGSSLRWGSTLVLITGMADDKLFDNLHKLRRQGVHIVLILCGQVSNARETKTRSDYFGIPMYLFTSEKDLDVWRK